MTRRFIAIYIASMFTVTGVAAQDSVQILSLQDCIKTGLDKSTQIIKSKDSLRLQGIELLSAYGQFLPDLNFTGNYSYTNGSELLTTASPTLVKSKVNEINYQLYSSFNIFNGLYDYTGLKATMLKKSAAQYSFERAQQAVTFDITQSYLQVVLDKHIVNFAKQNLDASTKREEQLNELTKVGRKAISDYYQQQAQTSQDKLYLIQSQNKLQNDLVLLLTKLKIFNTQNYDIADIDADTTQLTAEYMNEQQVIDNATHNRPDLKAADVNLQIALWRIKQLQSGYMPKLNLLYGFYSYGGYFNQLAVNGVSQDISQQETAGKAYFGQLYGGVALNLSWHIFDKLATKTSIDEAKVYREMAQLDKDDLALSISSDLKLAYNDFTSAFQQIATANVGLNAAQTSYEVLKGRYDVGTATFIELSNAQIAFFQAQISKEQAAINLTLQKKLIDYYIGK